MAAGLVLAKVNGANKAAQTLAMSGKTFTVGKISAAGNGLQNILLLTPTGNAGGTVAIKIQGAKQMAELASLSGKTITVAKPATLGAGANNWLAFKPVTAGMATATGKGSAASVTMVKLEGARQGAQAAALTGQKMTIVAPTMVGKGGAASTLFLQPAGGGDLVALKMANAAPAAQAMVGKSVIVGQAPMVAGNMGKWMVLKPAVTGAAAKTAAGGAAVAGTAATTNAAATTKAVNATVAVKAAAAKGATSKAAMTTVAATVPVTTATNSANAAAAKVATGAAAAKTTVASAATTGSIWKGTGAGLGMGLGLGAWGPVILAGVGAAAVYGFIRSRRNDDDVVVESEII